MRLTRLSLLSFALPLVLSAGCHHDFRGTQSAKLEPTPAPASAATAQAPFPTPPVLPGSADVAALVARVKPAVVNITTTHEIKTPRFDFDWPFGFRFSPSSPFGNQRMLPPGDDTLKQQALGSGFIIDAAGHVVTNAHVVDDADVVRVRLADDRELEAKVKGRDKRLDLAVLELTGAKDLPAATLGSSDALQVGEYVVAIGNPFGLGHTVTMGIVSAKGRALGSGPYDDFIQTDASINPGNSGGPLFNLKGEVVGINAAINPNGKGIGFAIPVDALKAVLPQLLSTGHVARGRLGVVIQPVDRALAKALGLEHPSGALVEEVQSGGPAQKAGIATGDVILRVDETAVDHSQDLPRIVARHTPGSRVKVTVLRDKTTKSFDVTLDQLPDKDDASSEPASSSPPSMGELGLELGDAPGGDGALVEGVNPGSPADEQLRPGDIIRRVNKKPIARSTDALKLLRAVPKGEAALLEIERSGVRRFVALERP